MHNVINFGNTKLFHYSAEIVGGLDKTGEMKDCYPIAFSDLILAEAIKGINETCYA